MKVVRKLIFIGFIFFSCTTEKKRFVDEDQDGFTFEDGDCNDNNATIYPNAEEICDGLDNNCDHEIDESSPLSTIWYQDADGDGFGSSEVIYSCTQPIGYINRSGDCNDNNTQIHPLAEESALDIGVDNRCDGIMELEEYDIHHQEQLPSSINQVFISNFLYAGPTIFLLNDDHLHRISYDLDEIIYEQEYTSQPWLNMYQNRDSELWYTQQNPHHSFEAQEYVTGQHISSFSPLVQISAFDDFTGDGEQYNAVSFQDTNTILSYSRNSMDIEEVTMNFIQSFALPLLSFQEIPDVNGDGYGELWVSLSNQGQLIYGRSTPLDESIWTLYYDNEERCTQIQIINWENDTPHVICQNGNVIAHELGPPNSSSSLNQGTYVFEGSVSSMTAISNYIFVQEQNEEIIHTFSSNEINPTIMYIDQGNSDLYVSEKSNPDIYLLSILEKTGYALSYKTIGIMHYSQ